MICSRCKADQPRDQFGPSAENWPERRVCRPCSRRVAQKRRHGLYPEQKTAIADHQGGCAICGHPEPGAKGWVLDHDRSCCDSDASCPKCRRGVLCQWCNSMLGYAFDRPETLQAAIEYLNARSNAERICDWHAPLACADGLCPNGTDETDAKDVDITHLASKSSVSVRARQKAMSMSEVIR